jgi:hypothetical protein
VFVTEDLGRALERLLKAFWAILALLVIWSIGRLATEASWWFQLESVFNSQPHLVATSIGGILAAVAGIGASKYSSVLQRRFLVETSARVLLNDVRMILSEMRLIRDHPERPDREVKLRSYDTFINCLSDWQVHYSHLSGLLDHRYYTRLAETYRYAAFYNQFAEQSKWAEMKGVAAACLNVDEALQGPKAEMLSTTSVSNEMLQIALAKIISTRRYSSGSFKLLVREARFYLQVRKYRQHVLDEVIRVIETRTDQVEGVQQAVADWMINQRWFRRNRRVAFQVVEAVIQDSKQIDRLDDRYLLLTQDEDENG